MSSLRYMGLCGIPAVILAISCQAQELPRSASLAPKTADMNAALAVDDVAGLWSFDDTASGKRCTLALSSLSDGGSRTALAENCSGGPFADSRSWRLAGQTFEVLDGAGGIVVCFQRIDVDTFQSVDGAYRLVRAPMA